MVSEFFAGLDSALGVDEDLLLVVGQFGVAVGFAAVVDVASNIGTTLAVDSPLVV